MPKVNSSYFEDKKNSILDAVESLCGEKPLYDLKMKDVINKTKLSPGSVYASFSDIDDVIASLFRRFNTADVFNKAIEEIKLKDIAVDKKVEFLIEEAVIFIQSISSLELKLMNELNVLAAADKERAEKLAHKLEGISTATYLPTLINLIETSIDDGIFKPSVSKESIYALIISFYDGLLKDLTFKKSYNMDLFIPTLTFEEKEMPKILSKIVLSLLN